MKPVKHLEILYLRETAIKELPSSIHFLTSLEVLDAAGCTQLSSLPISIYRLKSLEVLCLRNSDIKELSPLMKNLIALKRLDLHGTPIKEIPELPHCLELLSASDCESLETLPSINLSNIWQYLNFANCFKLDQRGLLSDMQLKIQSGQFPIWEMQILLPGCEISEWWGDQGVGSSVTMNICLPSDRHLLIGIAFCLVFVLVPPNEVQHDHGSSIKDLNDFDWLARSKGNVIHEGQVSSCAFQYTGINDLDHVSLHYKRVITL